MISTAEVNGLEEVTASLIETALGLPPNSLERVPEQPLLGALPELDSMSIVTILTLMEEQFGIIVNDDEVEASTFATLGDLSGYLSGKI